MNTEDIGQIKKDISTLCSEAKNGENNVMEKIDSLEMAINRMRGLMLLMDRMTQERLLRSVSQCMYV